MDPFPQPGDPEWLRVVVSQSSPIARPGAPPPPLPGPAEGYRALAAITPDPIVVVDAALRIASANDAFLDLFDESNRANAIGRSILLYLVEWERVRAANLVARFLDTGVWDIAELTALHPDGRLVPIEARCEILRDDQGRFAGMLVLVRDLTRREEAEDPLRAIVAGTSRATGGEYFHSLTQHLAQIFRVRMAVVAELVESPPDTARTIAFWSGDGFAENLTYPLAGTPCERVASGETCYYPEGVRRLFPDDAWLTQVGAEGYLGAPLTDSSGRVIGMLEVLDTLPIYRSRDVGSILRIFAARAAAELERRRLEAQLLQSQKLEGIGRLAGGIAHDFNNLLTAILGYCELGLSGLPPDSPVREEFELIRRAGISASGLTSQLLAFARRQMVSPRVVDLGALLTEIQPLLGRLAGDGIAVEVAVSPAVWPVRIDPSQLEQVLVNLVVNARDAIADGGQVTIAIENVAPERIASLRQPGVAPGEWVRISVTDTGSGIAPEVLPLVFEPFFTTKPREKGTGLGLATCHGIIHQAGGHIWLVSEPGAGTAVHCLLPRSSAPPLQHDRPTSAPGCRGRETVLVIEDDASVRVLTSRILRASGYLVLEAANGAEALELAAAHPTPLDMVVSDVALPQMSGPEVVRVLRERQPGLRGLFMSGYADPAVQAAASREPGTAFLAKPFSRSDLALAVREVLDTR